MSLALAGDYQTADRMAAKLSAIPIPADLTGLSVLDIGCDHGAFTKLAADRGAARVLGLDRGREVRQRGARPFVDLVARNRAQGWDRCSFEHFNLGAEWTEFGRFDLVFFFSVYHHVYALTGEHPPIWAWLSKHVAPGGALLFEGPVDTRDPIARDRARPHGGYTRVAILYAAEEHFHVEHVGPAIHRDHREVWRCVPRLGESGQRAGVEGVHAGADSRDRGAVRVEAVPGDAQPEDGPGVGGEEPGRARRADRAPDADRAAPVVESDAVGVPRRGQPPAGARRARRAVARAVHGGRRAGPPPGWGAGRGLGDPDPRLAVVLGGAASVVADFEALEGLIGRPWPGLVLSVNDIPTVWAGRLHHWVTQHPEKLERWERTRAEAGFPDGYERWFVSRRRRIDRTTRRWVGGSSALTACEAAVLELGCRAVVLCGCPMDDSPHLLRGTPWGEWSRYWPSWTTVKRSRPLDEMQGIVKSFGGRTRDALGEPTAAWLAEAMAA